MPVGATSAVRKLLSSSSLRPGAAVDDGSDVSSGAVPYEATSALEVGTYDASAQNI